MSRDVIFEENQASSITAKDHVNGNDVVEAQDDPTEDYIPDSASDDVAEERDNGSDTQTGQPQHKRTDDATVSDTEDHSEQSAGTTDSHLVSDTIPDPRRSIRLRNAPREWWKATALACMVPEHKLTFTAASKEEESASCKAAIQTEIDALSDKKI